MNSAHNEFVGGTDLHRQLRGGGADGTHDFGTVNILGTNDAPVLADVPNQTVAEDGTLTLSQAQILSLIDQYVSDVETLDAGLTFTLTVGGKQIATFTGGTVPADGVSFTQDANYNGTAASLASAATANDTSTAEAAVTRWPEVPVPTRSCSI